MLRRDSKTAGCLWTGEGRVAKNRVTRSLFVTESSPSATVVWIFLWIFYHLILPLYTSHFTLHTCDPLGSQTCFVGIRRPQAVYGQARGGSRKTELREVYLWPNPLPPPQSSGYSCEYFIIWFSHFTHHTSHFTPAILWDRKHVAWGFEDRRLSTDRRSAKQASQRLEDRGWRLVGEGKRNTSVTGKSFRIRISCVYFLIVHCQLSIVFSPPPQSFGYSCEYFHIWFSHLAHHTSLNLIPFFSSNCQRSIAHYQFLYRPRACDPLGSHRNFY